MEKVVIIPVLDPDEGLCSIVEKNLELGHQVILVDDGSDREYNQFFWELGKDCIVLHHLVNKGKGEAIKTGLKYIKRELWHCDVIGIMDADGQHLPEDMGRLLVKARDNKGALILGIRRIDGDIPWRSRLGNKITRQIFRLVTGVYVSDTQTGLRAFSADLLDFMLEIEGSRYEYEMGVLAACAREKIRIIEVPIRTIYHDKSNNCSHFRHIRDSALVFRGLLKFSASSLSSFLLDYGLFALLTFFLPASSLGILAANITARVFSALYNYLMNCRFVFHERENGRTAADYLILAAVILILNNLVLQSFTGILHIPVYPAKLMTECILFAVSWTVQRRVIFRREKKKVLILRKGGRQI